MLKRIKKFFTSDANQTAIRIPASEHGIEKRRVSSGAIKAILALQNAGHEAYLVGGGVRDLLLNGQPKDFDVATNATPEAVQRVFPRARIIGRRFKIVHVRMGRELIEVTTFRGSHQDSNSNKQAVQNDKGLLLRDNVYGDLVSDANRRDFTINALYYDPASEEIIDFTGGMQDLNNQRLRIIGDPDARYKEDPVRMLRALRFKCKLGFELEADTEAPIQQHADYLHDIPPARLFEEVLKLFLSGYASDLLEQLHHYHLLKHLFPSAASTLEQGSEQHQQLIRIAAQNTDKRIAQQKRVTPAFIYAAFLWPALRNECEKLIQNDGISPYEAMQRASQGVIILQQQKTSIPKRFVLPMRDIWSLQSKLEKRDPKRVLQALEHPRFRAAYDFLLLREESGEALEGKGDWWTQFQHAEQETQQTLIQGLKSTHKKRPKRRKPRPKQANDTQNS